jgi:hypothetical protein
MSTGDCRPRFEQRKGGWVLAGPKADRSGLVNEYLSHLADLKSRLAGGFCLRAPAQAACACANICEHCPGFRTDTGYLPVLATQKADAEQLARDAEERGWIGEADRHRKLIARLDDLIGGIQTG